jgi:hypothetical protein
MVDFTIFTYQINLVENKTLYKAGNALSSMQGKIAYNMVEPLKGCLNE